MRETGGKEIYNDGNHEASIHAVLEIKQINVSQ